MNTTTEESIKEAITDIPACMGRKESVLEMRQMGQSFAGGRQGYFLPGYLP